MNITEDEYKSAGRYYWHHGWIWGVVHGSCVTAAFIGLITWALL